jgi:hypothetical protein
MRKLLEEKRSGHIFQHMEEALVCKVHTFNKKGTDGLCQGKAGGSTQKP